MKSPTVNLWSVAVFAALSSAFGLIYSQLLVKTLMMMASNFLTAQTVTLGVYIAFMGLGTFLADRILEKDLTRRLPQIQLTMAICGMALVFHVMFVYILNKFYFVDVGDPDGRQQVIDSVRDLIWWAQPISALIGLLAGLELGLLIRLGRRLGGELGSSRVLAGSYAGTLAATLVFVWLIPVLAPLATSLVLASANIGFSLYLAWLFFAGHRQALRWHGVMACLAALLIFVASIYQPTLQQIQLKAREVQGLQVFYLSDLIPLITKILPRRPEILRHNTGYQNADFIFLANGGFRFLLDNHPQIERSWLDIYHEGLVHVPIQLFRTIPRKILILGGGDGVAMGELLRYGDRVDHIDLIELDPWMIHMASTHPFFTDLNRHSFTQPKTRVLNLDAILYLRKSLETYDAILVDFPLPHETELVKLFSSEFYRMLVSHLKPDGMVVMDVPLGCFRPNPLDHGSGNWRAVLPESLKAAGFKTVVSYCASDGFLLGRLDEKNPRTELFDVGLKFNVIKEGFLAQALYTDLAPSKVREPGDLNSIFKPLAPLKPRDF